MSVFISRKNYMVIKMSFAKTVITIIIIIMQKVDARAARSMNIISLH